MSSSNCCFLTCIQISQEAGQVVWYSKTLKFMRTLLALPSNLFPFAQVCSVFSEKAVAPHSSTLAWNIPWTEEPDRLQSMGSLRVGHFSLSCIREGNGNPFQCSCLKNPRDGVAWWAAIYGVAQSWTRLKQLSSSSSSSSMF